MTRLFDNFDDKMRTSIRVVQKFCSSEFLYYLKTIRGYRILLNASCTSTLGWLIAMSINFIIFLYLRNNGRFAKYMVTTETKRARANLKVSVLKEDIWYFHSMKV